MPDTIIVEQSGGVMAITLNRPDVLNAVNDQMAGELRDTLRQGTRDAAVRCVVITGAGRGFCSGQDLRDRAGGQTSYREHLHATYNPVISLIRTMEKPVLAAVNGVAAGAGCSLALAADLRVASERASFIEVFSRVGLVPDSGSTWFLPRLVGLGKALELAYLAEPVDAQEALRLGLVNRVVPRELLQQNIPAYLKNRIEMQDKYLEQIKNTFGRQVAAHVPELERDVTGLDMIRQLAEIMYGK